MCGHLVAAACSVHQDSPRTACYIYLQPILWWRLRRSGDACIFGSSTGARRVHCGMGPEHGICLESAARQHMQCKHLAWGGICCWVCAELCMCVYVLCVQRVCVKCCCLYIGCVVACVYYLVCVCASFPEPVPCPPRSPVPPSCSHVVQLYRVLICWYIFGSAGVSQALCVGLLAWTSTCTA